MDYGHPALITARRVGQQLGVLRPLQRLYRRAFRTSYEQAFDHSLLSEIRPGDTVWDVGANVGYYTLQFADAAGPSGRVLAFEPSPPVFEQLCSAIANRPNVLAIPTALSDHASVAKFDVRAHHHVGRLSDHGAVDVQVKRGDDIAEQGLPSVIKIDVEGFELEVLRGMPQVLSTARAVFIEVHFLELMQRGMAGAPKEIENLLRASGLAPKWIDASHLGAWRRP